MPTTGYIGEGRFGLFNMGDVSALSARSIESASIAGGVARLQRCEDGAWDPRENRNNDFYFVTTASANNNCRLWRLSFDDIRDPEQGGTIEILLRGDEGHKMLDNVTIDRLGRILMDEDPGNSTRISKIWLYAIDTRELIQVAGHNPKYFDGSTPNNPDFITEDEESSGIIDAAAILGDGWFLLDVQAHKASADPELVEGGQLLALYRGSRRRPGVPRRSPRRRRRRSQEPLRQPPEQLRCRAGGGPDGPSPARPDVHAQQQSHAHFPNTADIRTARTSAACRHPRWAALPGAPPAHPHTPHR